jgi:hypothetical protein
MSFRSESPFSDRLNGFGELSSGDGSVEMRSGQDKKTGAPDRELSAGTCEIF